MHFKINIDILLINYLQIFYVLILFLVNISIKKVNLVGFNKL